MTASPGTSFDRLTAELSSVLDQSRLEQERNVGALTTYRVGGAARLFLDVESSADLATVVSVTSHHELPITVLGRGSNLLVADRGFDGLVIRLGEAFATVEDLDDAAVRLGAAGSLPAIARRLTSSALTGFEWAVGVPGTVGGAVRMNAGGHGSDMAASVVQARVVDLRTGEVHDVGPAQLAFGYRTSSVEPHHLVVSADLALEPGDPARGQAELADIVSWRREHQPGGQNAGSVFTNPPGDSAGRLIERVGLKGFRLGSAAVSVKHANFIQADPGGRAQDIVDLMHEIVARVQQQTGIRLHAETRLIGFSEDEVTLITGEGSDQP